MVPALQVSAPNLYRRLDQPLYHVQTITSPSPLEIRFFHESVADPDITNVSRNQLNTSQHFKVEKISLMATPDSLQKDFYTLVSSSNLIFEKTCRAVIEIPTSLCAWNNVREIDTLLKGINKLPKNLQKTMLASLTLTDGFKLDKVEDLLPLEQFRVKLRMKTPLEFKKPLSIICLLRGEMLRAVY